MLSKKKYREILNPEKTAWALFYPQTHNKKIKKDIHIPPEWSRMYYKAYARMPAIPLPPPTLSVKQSLRNTLEKRISTRAAKQSAPLKLETLSTLLYYSVGMNNSHGHLDTGHRFYPSAGARYPIEAYVIAQNVKPLEKGIYHYYVRTHVLEKLSNLQNGALKNIFIHDFAAAAPCIIVLTGLFLRSTMKYSNRGYNYTLIETGHIGQNIYLLSSALSIGCCEVGGFLEKNLNEMLGVNTEKESALSTFAIQALGDL